MTAWHRLQRVVPLCRPGFGGNTRRNQNLRHQRDPRAVYRSPCEAVAVSVLAPSAMASSRYSGTTHAPRRYARRRRCTSPGGGVSRCYDVFLRYYAFHDAGIPYSIKSRAINGSRNRGLTDASEWLNLFDPTGKIDGEGGPGDHITGPRWATCDALNPLRAPQGHAHVTGEPTAAPLSSY